MSHPYPDPDFPPRILLGPGPSMVPPRVLRVMATPPVGHLDAAYLKIMDATQELLQTVFGTSNALTLVVPGTGSAGMEAAVANMVEPGTPVLVCANGYFGLRIAEMARRYGGQVRTLTRPWGEVFTADDVRAALEEAPAEVVAIVHGETSTGALQPIAPIAEVVHAAGGVLIVDTVASLGGVPFSVDEAGADVCYTGSQKCLSAPPGLAPITLSPRAVERLEQRTTPVTSWYLDLMLLRQYWDERRVYHHTGPVNMGVALYEALRLVVEEGLEVRWQRHRACAEQLWAGLEALGLAMHVPPEHRLASLTTVRVPEGVDEATIRREMMTRYNIEISGGLGELKGKVWRVGLMGYSARPENVLLLLAALEELLS
ncbi:MAG: alanine--glyoxylate aminotransferase family protein [Anaerolineae bacterium]